MSETADIVVVGAGIVGAACAEALSGEGLRVARRDMAPSLPPEVEFERRGTVWVAADEEEMDAVSPQVGRSCGDPIVGRRPAIDAAPYLPSRFR